MWKGRSLLDAPWRLIVYEELVMCLGVPGRIVKLLGDGLAIVDFGGIQREVDVSFIPDAKPGDYVVVHAGVAISRMDPEAAEEALQAWKKLLEEMDKLLEMVGEEEEVPRPARG